MTSRRYGMETYKVVKADFILEQLLTLNARAAVHVSVGKLSPAASARLMVEQCNSRSVELTQVIQAQSDAIFLYAQWCT